MKKKENNAILVVHAEAVCVSCEALTEAGGGSERSRGKCKREPLHGTRLAAKRRGPGHVLCRFSPCGKGSQRGPRIQETAEWHWRKKEASSSSSVVVRGLTLAATP